MAIALRNKIKELEGIVADQRAQLRKVHRELNEQVIINDSEDAARDLFGRSLLVLISAGHLDPDKLAMATQLVELPTNVSAKD